MSKLFIERPSLEWHHNIPFALARLNIAYAGMLTKLAIQYESEIVKLKPDKKWKLISAGNPTGSRYPSYNTFMLNPGFMPLFLALRQTFRFLLEQIGQEPYSCYLGSWFNIHREGQNLHRHTHSARFIGSFAAFTEGSSTSYGPLQDSDAEDHTFYHRNGSLIVSRGGENYHQVSVWNNPEHPRVSFAFDIIDQSKWKSNSFLIPFDGNSF
jgi:hypothetical protein